MGLTSPIVAATQFSGYMALIQLRVRVLPPPGRARSRRPPATRARSASTPCTPVVPLLLLPFLRPASREVLTGDRAAGASHEIRCGLPAAVACGGIVPHGLGAAPARHDRALGRCGARVHRGGATRTPYGGPSPPPPWSRRSLPRSSRRVGSMVGTGIVPVQLTLVGTAFAIVAVGLLAAARYENRRRSNGCASPRPRRPCPRRSRRRGRVDTTICGSDLCPAAAIDRGAGSHTNASF